MPPTPTPVEQVLREVLESSRGWGCPLGSGNISGQEGALSSNTGSAMCCVANAKQPPQRSGSPTRGRGCPCALVLEPKATPPLAKAWPGGPCLHQGKRPGLLWRVAGPAVCSRLLVMTALLISSPFCCFLFLRVTECFSKFRGLYHQF